MKCHAGVGTTIADDASTDLSFKCQTPFLSLRSAPVSEVPSPLPADEKRRAIATTHAFALQWWLSVLAWLELPDADALYVESAEDFETVSGSAGTVTQVKAGTSQALTLRSTTSIEALNHYWALRKVETRSIWFVLLSTTAVGEEQGSPFGAGVRGIMLWREAARQNSAALAEQLGRFLAADPIVEPKLSADLRTFCVTASGADLLTQLIRPIVFDNVAVTADAVRAVVEDRLIVFLAARYNSPVIEATRLPALLFAEIVRHASLKERIPLTRASFLRFTEAATIEYRKTIITLGSALPAMAPSGTSEYATVWEAQAPELSLPPAPALVALRSETVDELVAGLAQSKAVFLHGSTGMGKSTLAKLAAARSGKWCWIDAAGADPGSLQRALRQVFRLFDAKRGVALGLVIDGLDVDDVPAATKNTLRGLIWLVRQRGGSLLVTLQRTLPAASLADLGWENALNIAAPAMTAKEIKDYAGALGCTDAKLAEAWALILRGQTHGHPQLVHAGLLHLKRSGWPTLSGPALESSAHGVEEQKNQSIRLLGDLKDNSLELVTRLSTMGQTFRRDHALAMAANAKPIAGAGVCFDDLVGPWVEPAGTEGYFRVSPLIDPKALLASNLLSKWQIEGAVVRLKCEPVNSHDASAALRNALAAPDGFLIANISSKLLTTPKDERAAMFSDFIWVAWQPEKTCAALFAKFPHVEIFFRMLQVLVAAEYLPERAADYLTLAESALAHAGDSEMTGPLWFVIHAEVLFLPALPLPMARRLGLIERFAREAEARDSEIPMAQWLPDGFLPASAEPYTSRTRVLAGMTGMALHGAPNGRFALELVEALEAMNDERRSHFEALFSAWPTGLMLAFDKVWLDESTKPAPDWPKLLAWFEGVEKSAAARGAEALVVAAARARSIIYNEYLKDEPKALASIATLAPENPVYRAALLDQRAKIYGVRREYAATVPLMQQALAEWDPGELGQHARMVACQRAGAWAGKAELWQDSAEFFAAGTAIAATGGAPVTRHAGFLGDLGYARWRAGQKQQALQDFAQALDLCDKMPSAATNLAVFQVQKLVAYMLLALSKEKRRRSGGSDGEPVVPGMASDFELLEKIRTLPPPRLDAARSLLLTLEHDHGLGDEQWKRWAPSLLSLRSKTVLHFTLEIAGQRAIRDVRGEDFPALSTQAAHVWGKVGQGLQTDLANDLVKADQILGNGDLAAVQFDNALCGRALYLCGLISAVIQRKDPFAFLKGCEDHVAASPFPDDLKQWCQRTREILALDENAAYALALRGPDGIERTIAALALLLLPALSPVSLWVGCYNPLFFLNQAYWGPELVADLDRYSGERWKKACEQRFAFQSPTLFLPDVKDFCAKPVNGSSRLANILLSVLPALKLYPDNAILQLLKQMRENEDTYTWKLPGTKKA